MKNIKKQPTRRQFVRTLAGSSLALTLSCSLISRKKKKPNIVFVFGDQWRAQATGYAGDPNVRTPNLDEFADRCIRFTNAVSGCPVCSPYRASLMTGQYPLTHGVFLNDVTLNPAANSIAKALKQAGYDTGYIGKWHLDGHGRSNFIPKERRQGFEYWRAMECTHDYSNSYYYADENIKLKWPGYDAVAQTKEAQKYIRDHGDGRPFALFLSWGPPHAPYQTAPEKYRRLFDPDRIKLRPNVPEQFHDRARKDLAGYYAHIAVLDECLGAIVRTLHEKKLDANTILVFTSDHGDMLYSQGMTKKQKPFEESACIPLLLRYPAVHADRGRLMEIPFNTPDIMPTLLGLCHIDIPASVQGTDFSPVLRGSGTIDRQAVLLTCPSPFGQWTRKRGGKEYRGVRTRRYTFVRDLNGPWLLYDNKQDPFQMHNLCNDPHYAELQATLNSQLNALLQETGDEFLPGQEYIKRWGYTVDENGTVPYTI